MQWCWWWRACQQYIYIHIQGHVMHRVCNDVQCKPMEWSDWWIIHFYSIFLTLRCNVPGNVLLQWDFSSLRFLGNLLSRLDGIKLYSPQIGKPHYCSAYKHSESRNKLYSVKSSDAAHKDLWESKWHRSDTDFIFSWMWQSVEFSLLFFFIYNFLEGLLSS